MDARSDQQERYTGLILLSGTDSPGIASALFSTLEPFSITILDAEQIVIRSRLILTVLIELSPAHAVAIEKDLVDCASTLNVDIAISFSQESIESISHKTRITRVMISANKLTPGAIADVTAHIFKNSGNIERIYRSSSNPLTSIEFLISGIDPDVLRKALDLSAQKFGLDLTID